MASSTRMTATAARGLSPPGPHSDGPAIASRGLPGRGLKRAAADARSSVCNRLFDRQIDARAARTFEKQSMRQRFLRLRPRLTCDVYPAAGPSQDPEFAFIRRSSILEIVVGGGLIFGLAESGLCSAFDMDTGRRVCVLNRSSREVIRSLFHNKLNGTLIIVAVTDADQYSSLRCRSCSLEDLAGGSARKSTELFTSELLQSPGFVEFDDVNQKVLTFCAEARQYKVWSMAEPSKMLYRITDSRIDEIKISPGIMLLVLAKTHNYVPLKVISIETGQMLREFKQLVKRGEPIVVIEQFNQKLLLKQDHSPLNIIDLLTSELVSVQPDRFQTPFAFIFLYDRQSFLAFRQQEVMLWSLNGERISHFQDHSLWFPAAAEDHTSVIFITENQDVIISLCESRRASDKPRDQRSKIAIHVSHIASGECLARVDWHAHNRSTVTALSYNDTRGDLVVGDEHGRIHVWSN